MEVRQQLLLFTLYFNVILIGLNRDQKLGYTLGFLTAVLLVAVLFVFKLCLDQLQGSNPNEFNSELTLPEELKTEILNSDIILENTNIKQQQRHAHTTILSQPDFEMGWDLKPNVKLEVTLLRPSNPFNFDPPVLHKLATQNSSETLKKFIDQESLLKYQYSTDQQGNRTTTPTNQSEKKILVIGDSVAFGVGVDDKMTIASQLSKRLPDKHIINAGVGGFGGEQAVIKGKRIVGSEQYEQLVYIACQNDFAGKNWEADLAQTFKGLAHLSESFDRPTIVILHTYMEYNFDFLFKDSWWAYTDKLRPLFINKSKESGFIYLDWSNLLKSYQVQNKSAFSGLELYVDHCHLSPKGNALIAEQIVKELNK